MKRVIALALGSLVCATALAVPVIYQNDFASRSSEGAVPYGGWRAVNYVAGHLLANTNYTAASQFVESDLQDNWIKASNTCRNNAYVDDDNGNYVARLGDDLNKGTSGSRTTGPFVIVRQRIGNTFTNGTVTLTFDMRPPSACTFIRPTPIICGSVVSTWAAMPCTGIRQVQPTRFAEWVSRTGVALMDDASCIAMTVRKMSWYPMWW